VDDTGDLLKFAKLTLNKHQRYKLRHPERVHEQTRRYQEKNRAQINAKALERYYKNTASYRISAKKYKDKNKAKLAEYARKNSARHNYGLSFEEFDALFEKQNNRCAICGGTSKRSLDIDHNHHTGTVRALLCNACNRLVSLIERGSGDLVDRALAYLKSHASKEQVTKKTVRNCRTSPRRTAHAEQGSG
jgi:hypothetical protein